ncbi:MAG: hypothetical protein AB7P02_30150 [Alphaproteobacteria bacterium]
MADPSLEEFLELARRTGLDFDAEEGARMFEGWKGLRNMLIPRLPADPDMATEPALVFVPFGAGVAR